MSAGTILALISPAFNCVEMASVAGVGLAIEQQVRHASRGAAIHPAPAVDLVPAGLQPGPSGEPGSWTEVWWGNAVAWSGQAHQKQGP